MAQRYTKKNTQGNTDNSRPEYSVYLPTMITMKIHLKISEIGSNTRQNLERKIVQKTEGKCIPEGFVRPDTVKIITYSSGVIKMDRVEFQVVFKCLICNPVEGMEVECITRTITKAGIHAEIEPVNGYTPMKVFIARDHNYSNRHFGDIKEDAKIRVRIIGKRFELNDKYVVAIATLVDSGGHARQQPQQNRPKIQVHEEEKLDQND